MNKAMINGFIKENMVPKISNTKDSIFPILEIIKIPIYIDITVITI